jgi:glucuronoarabinoxylan endo-1,4-beta-xylanase
MKKEIGTIGLIAFLSAFGVDARAQTLVLSDNFDSYSLGAFGSTYNDASGGNVTATIVAPGEGGSGHALQLTGNITNGVTENAGVNSPVYTPTDNTDPNLSDYTLSFDLAITQGANTGIGVTLNIFGTGAADGSSYNVPLSQNTVGGGFQHFSVNLGSLPAGYNIPVLNPTDGQYSFQLLFLGYNASVTATPETIQLDNLQITITATNTSTVTTNSGTATVDPNNTYQTIEGLGGATAFYEGWIPAHPYQMEIYTNAFAGLNLSMLRLGDWYRYQTPLAGFDSADTEIVSNANRVLGHPVQVYMSSWSPPSFLKSNGETGNGGTLITNSDGSFDYAGFAQYWYDSINAYRSNGVTLTWASIQNEPDFVASYDSCILDPTEEKVDGTNYASYSKALAATEQMLTNLSAPPKLLAPETVHISYNDLVNYASTMDSNSFYGVTTHLYGDGGSTADSFIGALSSAANIFPGKPHFMTEYGFPDMINTACLIHDCLTVEQDSGFNYWSLVWPFPGNALVQIENPYASRSTWTNAPPGVTTDGHGWWLTSAYWAMKHFSYYIRPGYVRISASDSDNNVRTSAYLSPDGLRLVMVLINTNATAFSKMSFNVGAFNIGNSSVYQTAGTNTYAGTNTFLSLGSMINPELLPPLSLTTIVLNRAPPVITGIQLVHGNVAVAGTNGGTAGTFYYTLASTNLSAPLTNWTVIATNQFGPGGGFNFTNPVDPSQKQQFFILRLP